MASTGAENAISLADWARTQDPHGTTADVAELLAQSNEVINYIYWQMANGALSETVTQRVGLPAVYYRALGQGVTPSKSEYAQLNETMSLCDGWSEIDTKLVMLNAQRSNFRFLEGLGFIESMSQKFCNTLFNGDTTQTPTAYMGLNARYSTINPSNAANAQNVLSGGGSGSVNTSMWLMNFGPRSMYGIFPNGSKAGLAREDYGEVTSTVTTGLGGQKLRVMQEHFTWDAGLALKDWRWNSRICNIDTTNLKAQNSAANLLELMVRASYCVPSISWPASTTGNPLTSIAMTGRSMWVCNRTVRAMLHIQAINKSNNQLTYDTLDGKKMLQFMGIPILNCDQITNAEATVS